MCRGREHIGEGVCVQRRPSLDWFGPRELRWRQHLRPVEAEVPVSQRLQRREAPVVRAVHPLVDGPPGGRPVDAMVSPEWLAEATDEAALKTQRERTRNGMNGKWSQHVK